MLMWREDKELSKYSRSKAKMDLTKIGQVASVLALLAHSLGFCWGDNTHLCPLTCACIGFAGILGWRGSRVVTVVTTSATASVRQRRLRWKWVGESIYGLETSSELVSINDEK